MPYVLGIISAHYQWDYAVDLCLDPVMPFVLGIISAVSVALCCRFLPPVWWIFGLFAFTPSTLHLPSHPQVWCTFGSVRFHISCTTHLILKSCRSLASSLSHQWHCIPHLCFESVAPFGVITASSVALPSPPLPWHPHCSITLWLCIHHLFVESV